MRITFEDHSRNVDRPTNEYRTSRTDRIIRTDSYALDISGTVMDNTAYGVKGRTAEDVMQAAANQDVELLRDYMTVMSNSMSEEDFARLQKEGYSPTDTDIETVVTIVDKIKAEMAKAGVNVVGYTDTLDDETLTEIAGSESYARAIRDAFQKADVPLTEQNVTDAANAMDKALKLTTPSEGAEKYMLDNELEPTIDDLYRAEFSGIGQAGRQAGGYYREEMSGYYARRAEQVELADIQSQVEQIIESAGMEVSEETLAQAEFLLQKGLPLTADNLVRLDQIRSITFPVDRENVWKTVASALSEGKEAGEANLYDGRSVYEKAADIDADVDRMLAEAEKSGSVSAYRQLQEIRLMMTVEANVKLIKSGFSIDTSNLEELVDALKGLEQKQAESLFGTGQDPAADYSLYKETLDKKTALPYIPADVAGRIADRLQESTITEVYEEGRALERAYREAGQSYEALMTVPRRDMGDNIRTAFRNVDDILTDMGLSLTEENRRAVRILGYNSMDITEEHISSVKAADRTLQRVVDKMTPGAVLKMIRDGVNPLEAGLTELETYLDGQETYEGEALKYSRYLYKLEQNKTITGAEKEAYIGIYRMLRQIEKTDGASIGALIGSGMKLDFSNLLTAVRSTRAKGINVTVDDEFGGLEQLIARGDSITDQIAAGYTRGLTDAWSDSLEMQNADRQILEQTRQIMQAADVDLEMLRQMEIPVTVDYLLASSSLRQDRGGMFRSLRQKQDVLEQVPGALEQIDHWEDLLTDRENAVQTYTEYIGQLEEVAEELTFAQQNSAMDVRAMQLIHKQLYIAGQSAQAEEYDIPVVIGDEMTAIHLTLKHSEQDGGKVSVNMEFGQYGKVAAFFTVSGQKVTGYMTAATDASEKLLQNTASALRGELTRVGTDLGDIPVLRGSAVIPERDGAGIHVRGAEEEERDDTSVQDSADTAELYRLAKLFIRSLKQHLS